MKGYLVLFILIQIFGDTKGQEMFSKLKVGDVVTNVTLNTHLGTTRDTLNLVDFHGKLIILDFWGIHCPSCQVGLPHLLELQNTFKDKIKVFVVTKDKGEDVDRFWNELFPELYSKYMNKSEEKREEVRKIAFAGEHLPFVVGDTILDNLFSHPGTPTHVWIDSNFVYQGTTYPNTTSEENVRLFLEGKRPKLREFRKLFLDKANPVSWIGVDEVDGVSSHLRSFSLIFNRIENGGYPNTLTLEVDSLQSLIGFSCINQRILDLYKTVYFGYRSAIPDSRVIVETASKVRFYEPPTASFEWGDTNLVCYASRVPFSRKSELYTLMKQDLDRYLGVESKKENRRVKCYVLKGTMRDIKISNGRGDLGNVLGGKAERGSISIGSYEDLSTVLEEFLYSKNPLLPFVNELSKQRKFYPFRLLWDSDEENNRISEIQKDLRKYNIELSEEYRDIDIIVLRDSAKGYRNEPDLSASQYLSGN